MVNLFGLPRQSNPWEELTRLQRRCPNDLIDFHNALDISTVVIAILENKIDDRKQWLEFARIILKDRAEDDEILVRAWDDMENKEFAIRNILQTWVSLFMRVKNSIVERGLVENMEPPTISNLKNAINQFLGNSTNNNNPSPAVIVETDVPQRQPNVPSPPFQNSEATFSTFPKEVVKRAMVLGLSKLTKQITNEGEFYTNLVTKDLVSVNERSEIESERSPGARLAKVFSILQQAGNPDLYDRLIFCLKESGTGNASTADFLRNKCEEVLEESLRN